jgi:hypothetical protein
MERRQMKRSEALDIIDDVLYKHDLPLLQGIDKEILGRLEKAKIVTISWEPENESKSEDDQDPDRYCGAV